MTATVIENIQLYELEKAVLGDLLVTNKNVFTEQVHLKTRDLEKELQDMAAVPLTRDEESYRLYLLQFVRDALASQNIFFVQNKNQWAEDPNQPW